MPPQIQVKTTPAYTIPITTYCNTIGTQTFCDTSGGNTIGGEVYSEDANIQLRYKVRMMGFPLEGPCNVLCDNNAVVQNTSRPESMLKKKHLSVAYHRCREAQAAGTICIAKEGTNTNIADMFTKLLAGTKLRELCRMCLW